MSEHMPLKNDPLDLLRHELAAVEPSQEFASRVRDRIANEPAELAALRDELADLTPSPAFAARVRQQIEEDGRRSFWPWSFSFRWMVVASSAAALILAGLVLFRLPEESPVPRVVQVSPQPASQTLTPLPTTPTVTPAVATPARRSPSPKPEPTAVVSEPAFEVITNQPQILRELWDRAQSIQAVPPALSAPVEIPALVVSQVQVETVAVKWLVEPPKPLSIPFPLIYRLIEQLSERSTR